MKLTPTWQKLVTKRFEINSKRLHDEFNYSNITEPQKELLNYLIESGVNDSKKRVEDFLSGYIRLGAFDKTPCQYPIDWQADPFKNRTWQWLHHQLALLGDFTLLLFKGQQDFLVDSACAYIDSWVENNFVQELPSEFSWGDHATAHRLKNLANFLLISRNKLPAQKFHQYLTLVEVHCRVLSTSKFFNKHTNHGLDQVLYLLIAACYFPEMKSANRFKAIAMSRLEGEINYGFADDGVHTENSPQYHFILLNRLALLHALQNCFKLPTNLDLGELFEKAIKFAKFIKRPDGLIPIIGDSEQKLAFLSPLFKSQDSYAGFLNDEFLKPVESHLFKSSGYYTYRQQLTDNRAEDIHFVLKCGYLSNYHRQDDDGSFVLMAYGEDWFVDGGLYKHKNDDPIREYLRSVQAHNTINVHGEKIHRTKKFDSIDSSLSNVDGAEGEVVVEANIDMYVNLPLVRKVIISESCFKLQTYILPKTQTASKNIESSILFHVPNDKKIIIEGDKVTLVSQISKNELVLKFDSAMFEEVALVTEQDYNCFSSKKVGELERVQTIAFKVKSLSNKNCIKVQF